METLEDVLSFVIDREERTLALLAMKYDRTGNEAPICFRERQRIEMAVNGFMSLHRRRTRGNWRPRPTVNSYPRSLFRSKARRRVESPIRRVGWRDSFKIWSPIRNASPSSNTSSSSSTSSSSISFRKEEAEKPCDKRKNRHRRRRFKFAPLVTSTMNNGNDHSNDFLLSSLSSLNLTDTKTMDLSGCKEPPKTSQDDDDEVEMIECDKNTNNNFEQWRSSFIDSP